LRFTNTSQEIFHFSAIFFFIPECLDKNCCSVAVLQFSRSYSYTLKILLYLYINIELIFDFRITYFGTATLQRLQHIELIWVCLDYRIARFIK